jgi:uncharacterized UPF0160 family protein
MIKFNFGSLKGDIYNQIKHDSRLKDVDWSKFFKKDFVIITHSGQFHADDVFCVALTYILYVLTDFRDDFQFNIIKCKKNIYEFINDHVIRVPTIDDAFAKYGWLKKSDKNIVVFDIVGGHYDHHCVKKDIPQMTFDDLRKADIELNDFKHLYKNDKSLAAYDTDSYKLCSFGQLWQHIGRGFNYEFTNLPEKSENNELYRKLIDLSVFSKIFKEYALPISLVDLNGPKNWNNPISRVIANCNRDSEFFEFAGGFYEAVRMAVSMLYGEINNIQNQCEILDDVYGKLNHSGTEWAYVSEFAYDKDKLSYIVIPDGCDMNINLSTLEYIYVRNSDGKITNPLFIFNQNPSTRDGSYRIVFGSRMVLNKQCIDNIGVKYKFCHEAGFMITFETIKDAQDFIESMQLAGSMWNYRSDTCEAAK